MVTASAGFQTDLSQVVHSSCRSFCHSPQPQSSTVRVSSSRPKCLGHRCSEHKLVGSHCLCLPSHSYPLQGDPKSRAIQLPDHRNSPRLARDALVLGPSAALNRNPNSTSSVKNSSQTVPQLCVPQQSTASQPPRLVSRSGQLQEQGFSVEVAKRIAAPQRSSTRTIYQSKWALCERWCRENSVDFSTPSIKQVADFFMYQHQDLNRRPLTIDGYRTAIVDTLGPTGLHICQSSDLKGESFRPETKSPQITKIIHLKSLYTNINKHHSLLRYSISPLTALINSTFQTKSSQGILLLVAVFLLF